MSPVSAEACGGLRVCLLGRFELRCGGRVVLDRSWPRSKAKALLKLVALEGGQVHRDRVLDALWPELDAKAAAANLRKNLHHLRTALADRGVECSVIEVRDELLQLGAGVSVDVADFRALARVTLDGGDVEALAAALSVYDGDLLPEDLYEEWTVAHRRELQERCRQLLVKAARADEAGGHLDRAIARLETVLRSDPFDEDVHRALMRIHMDAGSRHRALRQFQECARRLRDELGVDPSPETSALLDAIVIGSKSPTAPSRSVPEVLPPLFGREAEMESALDLVDAAAAGQGGMLLVAGVAGIGKSRFASAVLTAAETAGARVVTGRSYELEATVAYQPVRDALRQLAGDPDAAATLLHTVYVKRLLGAAVPAAPVADPVLLESELVDEVVRVLIRLAGSRPLALLVEDVHLSDTATIGLLHVLGRRLSGSRVLLLLTYRSDEVLSGSTAGRLVESFCRQSGVTTIELGPLSDAALELVIRVRLGDQPVEPSLVRSVLARAEGNPLFASELIDTMRATGAARVVGGRWQAQSVRTQDTPAAVRALVQRRMERFGDRERHVLSAAAVFGRSFDYELLRRTTAASDDELLDALDRAIGAWLLEEDDVGYRFRHELVRAAVYECLTQHRREWLHRAAADALLDAGRTVGVGHHLAASDQPWRAVPVLRDEARAAAAVFANDAARATYEQAITIARAKTRHIEAPVLAELLEELGDLAIRTGDAQRGAACLREALNCDRVIDDEAAVLRVQGKAALAHIVVGDVAGATELLQTHMAAWERVLAADQGEAVAAWAPSHTLHMLADIRWHSGNHDAALEAAEHAVHAAESSGDVVDRARAYESFALAAHSLGDWRRGLEFEMQRGSLGLPGFTDIALDAHYCLLEYHLYGDSPYADTIAHMKRALARAEEVGNVRAQAIGHHGLGATQFLIGDWAASERSLRHGIELASSVGSTFGVVLGHQRLAVLETATGRFDAAADRLGHMLDVALGSDDVAVLVHSPTRLLAALAANRLAAGDLAAAEAALTRGFDAQASVVGLGYGECVTCDVLLYPVAVAARLARRDFEGAEQACQRVEQSTTWFHGRSWIATAHEVRGLLARAEGNTAVAVDQLEQARAGFAALGQPYDEARCIATLATVIGNPGQLAKLAEQRWLALGAVPPALPR